MNAANPTVDVGLEAERMDDRLVELAEAGYVDKLVTVIYGDSGESRTGYLRWSLADGPDGYWLD